MRPSGLVLILGVLALAARGASAQEVVAGDSASAQAARAAAWFTRPAVGVQVGYSRADLALGGSGNLLNSRQGAITGVYLQFPVRDFLAIRPELLFSLKGGRTVATGLADIDIELAYLELPLLLRASIPTGSLRPVLFAGPSVAFQIGCDFTSTLPGDSTTRLTCGQDALTTVREWDFGLVGGGGVEMRLRRATIALEARYTAGTRSVLEGIELKNRSFGLVLALLF
jgi:outer membrane protein with beta-barrel domain